MLGRFTLHNDRTLFLFVFAADSVSLPATLDGQKAMLRDRYGDGKWECPRILDELDRTEELYFDRVSQIRMKSWSRGRVALVGDAAFCVSLTAGQGSALAMISAYVLAGELANAGGRHDEAFGNYESFLRNLYLKKATWRRTLCRRPCAKDTMGPFVPQPSDKGVCNSRTGKACDRQGYYRRVAPSRLPLALSCIDQQLGGNRLQHTRVNLLLEQLLDSVLACTCRPRKARPRSGWTTLRYSWRPAYF